jgi:tape measure domain-containing protein
MAYGFTADEAQRLARATIDYAAGAGLSVDVMNQIALALGQIKANGKLSGQEMLQLVNAGIDVRDALAQSLGITAQEVSERLSTGMIDANTAIEAIVSTLENDFAGAAKAQANTVSGLVSTLEELKRIGLRELLTGVVEALRPVVSIFIEWLQSAGIAKLREIGQGIGDLAVQARQFAQDAAPAFQAAMAWIKDNGETIRGALLGVAIAFGALAVVGTVTTLIAALANPITLIIAAAGLLGAAWANNWGGIREKTAAVWAWLQPVLESMISWLRDNVPNALIALQNIWKKIWDAIQETVDTVLPIMLSIYQAFRAAFQGDWKTFGEALRTLWDRLWSFVVQILDNAWRVIQESLSTALLTILSIYQGFRERFQVLWDAFGAMVRGSWDSLWSVIVQTLNNAWNAIQEKIRTALSMILSMYQEFRGEFQSLWDAFGATLRESWSSLWSLAVQTLSNAWNAIRETVRTAFSGILSIYQEFQRTFQGSWSSFSIALRGTWDSLWSTIKQTVSDTGDAIRSSITSLVQAVAATFRSINWRDVGSSIIEGIVSGISGMVNTLVQAAKNAAKAALDAAKGVLGVRSPSRAFEDLGGKMMQGWIRGIERMISQLEVAAGVASTRAVQAATINNYNLTVQSVRSAEQIERDFWLMRG